MSDHSRVSLPQSGVTVRAHVEELLLNAVGSLELALVPVQAGKRVRPAEREFLRRELAGVIADCETVRLWLDKGAPDVTFRGTE